VVPFPLTAAQGACTVEAEQVLPGLAYQVRGRGFVSGESVKPVCECGRKKMRQGDDLTSDDKGQWSTIIARDPKEKSDRMKLLFQGQMCAVPLDLAFGKTAVCAPDPMLTKA